jgi:hypothetical protein
MEERERGRKEGREGGREGEIKASERENVYMYLLEYEEARGGMSWLNEWLSGRGYGP